MGLGDSLNSLSGGYQRGQAQYAANEKARQDAAAAGAKAAQDAAEFRLKLATHSQALTNSAEDEWNAITAEINSDNWDPAKLPALLPRVANFDKTYGAVWGGGSATEMIQKALHLTPGGEPLREGEQGPVDPNAANPLAGFTSQGQKDAADKKARESRTAEAARGFAVGAAEYIRKKYNGMPPDESTYMAEMYNYQEMATASGGGKYDPEVIDAALDVARENVSGYFKAVADDMARISGNNDLSLKINEKIEATRKTVSTWITSVLRMDADGGGLADDLFAQRTPIRLAMEADASRWATSMEPNQLIANLISKYQDAVDGGLNLDPKAEPWVGSLTIAGLPTEGVLAMNKFYDLNVAPNPSMTNPIFVNGKLGMIDYSNPANQWLIWEPIQTPATPSVIQNQDTPYPKVPANSSAASVTAPKPKPAEKQKPAEKPKEPEVPVAELMARDPSSLNGVEMARVTNSMTGPEFIRWMVGKGGKK